MPYYRIQLLIQQQTIFLLPYIGVNVCIDDLIEAPMNNVQHQQDQPSRQQRDLFELN